MYLSLVIIMYLGVIRIDRDKNSDNNLQLVWEEYGIKIDL